MSGKVKISLQEITEDSLSDVLSLEVADAQKHLIANNAKSIAQAHFSKFSWMRAIYADNIAVGFVLLYLDPDSPHYEIWRLMIDKDYQGRGYGRQAMETVITFLNELPDCDEIYLCYVPEKGNASRFFKTLGFVDSGEFHGNEKEMKLELL
ncbi:MAG: GNAT family N-acetyltransferase [Spirochaetales bacterium]|uniref:GNAT family N-acetyltransferase n=1 Tax=Candidatus Thalassospirochaeta sargassi TaxID=3119039 RepID=A0AAJ1MN75_9SPIO|nr:GNAT family N-acetyltransferase [Spirochaetales bacterium]